MPDMTPLSTASTAAQIPPIAPEDARFHDVTQDSQLSAERAWRSVEPFVSTLATPKKLPKVDLEYAAGKVIGLWPVLAELRAPTLHILSAEQAVKTAAALDSLPRWAFALLYVCTQEANEPGSGVNFRALIAESNGLVERGLVWCQVLEGLGLIQPGTTRAIKKGYPGHRETISDIQALFDALNPHRTALAAQVAAYPTATPLTSDDLTRMGSLALILRQIMERPDPATPWRTSLLRIAPEFERNYQHATTAIRFYLTISGQQDRLTSLPQFLAFRRPPTPAATPAAPAVPGAGSATPPTQGA